VQAEGVIAALIGAVSGGGGVRILGRLVGPERDTQIAQYYRSVISDLYKENQEVRKINSELHGRLGKLEGRIRQLELAQDEPPGYLG
jgi:hypothetical protein